MNTIENRTANFEALAQFASQVHLRNHCYLSSPDGIRYILSEAKTQPLNEIIKNIIQTTPDDEQKQLLIASLSMIHSHLLNKINGLLFRFLSAFLPSYAEKREKLITLCHDIHKITRGSSHSEPCTPATALLKFYQEEAEKIGIQDAASERELRILKLISHKIWQATQNYEEFKKHMASFFKGEHFILDDNEEIYKMMQKVGTLRGSSHYDKGTTSGNTGGPVPLQANEVSNAQYGLDGPQFKHLLAGRVSLAQKDSSLIPGKTFDQVTQEMNIIEREHYKKLEPRSWLQTEASADSTNPLTLNFWRHRVRDFGKYVFYKIIIKSETPNIGPYGRGHGDDHPTIL